MRQVLGDIQKKRKKKEAKDQGGLGQKEYLALTSKNTGGRGFHNTLDRYSFTLNINYVLLTYIKVVPLLVLV